MSVIENSTILYYSELETDVFRKHIKIPKYVYMHVHIENHNHNPR